MPAHIALLDANGVILAVNEPWKQFARANGMRTPAFGVGENYLGLCDAVKGAGKDEALHALSGLRAVLNRARSQFSLEYPCDSPNESRWFRMTVSPLGTEAADGAVVMHFDISERMRSESAERETAELLKAVMSGTPDGIFVRDLEGRFLFCNQAQADFMGCPVDALIGNDGAAALGFETASEMAARDRAVLESERELTTELDGTIGGLPRALLSTRAPYRNDMGDIIGVIGISRDIADRKLAEAAREQERRLLRTLIDALPDVIYAMDAEGRFSICNPVAAAHCGAHSEGELIGRTALEVFPPATAARFYADDLQVLTEQAVRNREEYGMDAQGRPAWFLSTKVPLHGSDGAVVGLVGISRDITAQKLAETQAREFAARLDTTLQSLADGFYTLDRQWRFTYLNVEAERILGQSRETLLGQVVWDLFPKWRGAAVGTALQDAMAGSVPVKFIGQDESDEALWLDVRAYPSDQGLAVALRDISEDRAVRQQLLLLEASVSRLNDIVLITEAHPLDAPGPRIVFVNAAFTRISGHARDHVLGKSPRLLQGPLTDRKELDRIRVALSNLEPVSAEIVNYTKDGEPYWVEIDIVPFGVEGQPYSHFVAVERDITQRKRDHDALLELNESLEARVSNRTAALRRALDDAEQANRAKSVFLATMSHEIRTPMNGVISMVDVLHQTSLKGHQVEMVGLIRDSAFSLLQIIDDILDFSKIEAGKLLIENEAMRVAEVVEKVCGMLGHVATKAGAHVSVFVDPAIPRALLGDETRLRQVLINLVGNAIKFSSGLNRVGEIRVRVSVIARELTSVTLELVVVDNGIGMDQKTQALLFVPFSQADASTTRRFGGTGLGLAISSMLVNLMGGEISVQSAPDQGSTFSVRLPFVEVVTADERDDTVSLVTGLRCRIIGGGGGGAEHILADDFSTYLRHAGVSVDRYRDVLQSAAEPQAPGLWLWVILPGQPVPDLDELRAMAPGQPDAKTRFVVLGRGKRRQWRVEAFDLVRNDADLLLRRTLFVGLALAAGRLREEEMSHELELPAAQVRAPTRHEAKLQGRLILVAEDNETNRKVIQHQLQLIGFAAEIVADGRAALACWRTGDFALLLTDLHMPELDGYSLASAIRSEERDGRRIPIIALTANALRGEELRCRAAGMDAYLSKPVRLPLLKSTIEKWLGPAGDTLPETQPSLQAPVSESPPADLRVLVALVGDSKAVIEEVLHAFRASACQSHEEIKRGCADGSSSLVSDAAHKLKSAARSIGAARLGDICAEIETVSTAGQSGNLLPLLLPSFEAEIHRLFIFLDSR